jgi:hypothetical protein
VVSAVRAGYREDDGGTVAVAWLALVLAGCSGDGSPHAIRSGDYQFYTTRVADGCLDGALEALFMPEGADQRHAFEYPIYVPSVDETPLTYEVSFREPFVGMPVTVERSPGGLQFRGSVMDAVLLDEAAYGDCVATMSVDADVWPAQDLGAEGRISVSNLRGSDGRCPVPHADPCLVVLSLTADRIGPGTPTPVGGR